MDSPGSSSQLHENAQQSSAPVDLEWSLLDTDGIFGSTSHLQKRKQKVRTYNVTEGLEHKDTQHYKFHGPRKRLHSAEEVQHGCRPNPEGSGDSPCQQCHIITDELNRQALALVEPGMLKDPSFAALLLDRLQALEWPPRGQGAESRCDLCGTPLHQLRRQALHSALGLALHVSPDRRSGSSSGLQPLHHTAHSLPPQQHFKERLNQIQSRLPRATQRPRAEPVSSIRHREMGWIKSGATGVDIKPTCFATVTPLPIYAQHYLEGVWSVARVSRDQRHQYTQNLVPDKDSLTSETFQLSQASAVPPITPPVHKSTNVPAPQSISASSFFLRAAQKLNLSKRKKPQPPPPSPPDPDEPLFYTDGFSAALQLSPPPVPPCLLRAGAKVKDSPGMGKVKVMVRICPAKGTQDTSESMSFLKVDAHKKQLTFCEPSTSTHATGGQKRSSSTAPKIFNFDAVFTQDASQAEICSGTVAEVIQSVVNGADGCIFCFGHANLGKTYTMIGSDSSTQNLGVVPCAISWLYKFIEERKEKTCTRFSVRVSAVEISGRDEVLTDLLADFSGGVSQDVQGVGVYLREDPVSGSQLQNQSELRASSAERAAFFLDSALAARSIGRPECDKDQQCNSHMLFTLHVTQYRMEKSSKGGMSEGRSRLHLLDLGSCESDMTRTRDGGGGGQCLSLTALGNVILALTNGAKHVPYRDSKLTMLLRESLGNINCRTTMIAHISDSQSSYTESLSTVQLASRIHRMRKKKSKYASSSSGGESSCEEGQNRRPPHLRPFHPRMVALDPDHSSHLSSDPDYSSSSEHSCDTVIYVGPGGAHISDRELSDNEGPPAFVPIIPSLNKKRAKEAPRSDGDHLKCNTFAELQERLECIDGSESTVAFTSEVKVSQMTLQDTDWGSVSNKSSFQKPGHVEPYKLLSDVAESEPKASAQDSELVVREKVYHDKVPLQKPPKNSNLPSMCGLATRTPPVGMSNPSIRQGGHVLDQTHHLSRSPMEVSHLRASLQSRCLDRDILRTTVTLQQPVELNGEDELVFTVVEELPTGLVPDNGRPSSIISFNSDNSLQALSSGSRPVSIISSINDEFDAYVSQIDRAHKSYAGSREGTSLRKANVGEANTDAAGLERGLSSKDGCTPDHIMKIPSSYIKSFSQQSTKGIFSASAVCLPELDYQSVTSERKAMTKCPPLYDTSRATSQSQKLVKSNTISSSQSQIPAISQSTLPRKNKPTSSVNLSSGFGREMQWQGSKTEEQWAHTGGLVDPRNTETITACKMTKSGMTGIPSRKAGGSSNSVPRSPKMLSSQRVVDGCEKSTLKKGDSLTKMPLLRRGATTLGMITVPQSFSDSKSGYDTMQPSTSLRYSSLGKRSNGQKSSLLHKSGSMSPPAPPVRKSSLDHKTRVLSSSALRSLGNDQTRLSSSKASVSEEDFDVQGRGEFFHFKTSSLKSGSSQQARGPKGDSGRYFSSLLSLERCDSLTSIGSRHGSSRESSGANLGSHSKSTRTVPRLGITSSTSTPLSPPSSTTPGVSKLGQIKASISIRTIGGNGTKAKSMSLCSSKPLSSTKSLSTSSVKNANLPPSGKTSTRSLISAKPGKGTLMGTKQAVRAANSRVSELASSSPKKHIKGSNDQTTSSSDCKPPLRTEPSLPCSLPSPYSKITAPRRPQRYSSGHGSDNSSVLSGELPPAMGRTALFYHSGGSSGYESMIRDSETTGSASSAHDSMSESGVSTSSRTKVSKSPKKRGNGLQRRRLIPAPLPDASSPGRKVGAAGQWVDLAPLGGTLKKAFEIKVYEIDDVDRLQKCKEGTVTEPIQDVQKGLQYFSARLRMMERRQQQIKELRAKHERLKGELEDAKARLMLDPDKWMEEFDVDPDLDPESHDFLEALAQATSELEFYVDLCKSRVMMETCFDILAPTSPGQTLEV
ncbi:kinesin-like protein KIF26A [Trichomycterus rosablanca]|uniref:kinesin-like protein KIF26A n=1 Tax=Trichomycterus rosablanca TaxID=2290929 RepID=UPI002F35159F